MKYSYIDKTGKNAFVEAATADEALKTAKDIGPHSGVQLEPAAPEVKPDPLAQITTGGEKPSVVTSTSIDTAEQKKIADQAKADQDDETTLARLARKKQIQDLSLSLAPEGGAPVKPDLTGEYSKLLGEKTASGYSYGEMQTNVTELNKQKEEAMANLATFKRKTPVGVSEGFAQGAISEEQQKVQDEVDRINREITVQNLQISNRSDVINTLMGLKKEDYANATSSYDKEFARNVQLYNSTMSSGNVEKDNARANLQVIQNEIQKGTLKYDSLDEATKNTIASLEDQAGMPRGLTQFITGNVKGDVVSSGTRTENGNQYFDVLTRDPITGAMKVTSIYKGATTEGEGNDEEKIVNDFMADVSTSISDIDTRSKNTNYDKEFRRLKAKWGDRGFTDEAIHGALGQ